MLNITLSTIAKIQYHLTSPSTDEWIEKMHYVCTVAFYVDIQKIEIV